MIYLIGVDHQVQHDGPTMIPQRKRAISELRSFLESKAKELKISLIAEELNEEVLKCNRASIATVQDVAKHLGVAHLFCDPTTAQRKEFGIHNDQTLREQYWLSRLEKYLNRDRILLVCGAGHLETFREKLAGKGCKAEIIPEQFGIGLPAPVMFAIGEEALIEDLEP